MTVETTLKMALVSFAHQWGIHVPNAVVADLQSPTFSDMDEQFMGAVTKAILAKYPKPAPPAPPAPPADTTPPVTVATVSDQTVAPVTVTLTATDSGSGVGSTLYILDGEGSVDYTAPIVVSEVGSHTLRYQSVDRAGNVEAVQSVTFSVPVPAQPVTRTTLATYKMSASDNGRTFEHVDFVGGDANDAVLSFLSACQHITLKDYTVAAGPWNGVSLNVTAGDIHDITFDGGHILASARMGIECTQRPSSGTVGYSNIKVLNTIIEAVGEEALSFDGGYFAATGCEIGGCTIMGSNNSANPQFSGAIEINGPTQFYVHDTVIYACKMNALNLEGPVGVNGGLVFRNLVVDYSVLDESLPTDSSTARLLEMQNVVGAVFDHCTFNTGSAANHAYNAGYLTGTTGCDFSTSTITGVVSTIPVPTTAPAYFSADSASTGTIWPVKV